MPESERDVQRIQVRIPLDVADGFDPDLLLAVFGRWRLEDAEEVIDLADYTHVPDGPGVLLVSHRWHLGISGDRGRRWLYFATRKGLSGTDEARIEEALRGAVEKAHRLLGEPELSAGARLDPTELEIVFNDRRRVPDTTEVDAEVRPALAEVLDRLYGAGRFEIDSDARQSGRLAYHVRAGGATAETLGAFLSRPQTSR